MASVEELLLNSLRELMRAELKEFQWHLQKDHECIPKYDMENADRLKTVDKMVACSGPEEAVKITVKILRKMHQNHLADQLENKQEQGDKAPVQMTKRAPPGANVVNACVMTGNTFTGPVTFYR